jgi:hypothetical protein
MRIATVPGTEASRAYCFDTLLGRSKTMRWKISHGGHDPRQIDLIAIFALLILIAAACWFFSGGSNPPSTTAFIDPSQTIRW